MAPAVEASELLREIGSVTALRVMLLVTPGVWGISGGAKEVWLLWPRSCLWRGESPAPLLAPGQHHDPCQMQKSVGGWRGLWGRQKALWWKEREGKSRAVLSVSLPWDNKGKIWGISKLPPVERLCCFVSSLQCWAACAAVPKAAASSEHWEPEQTFNVIVFSRSAEKRIKCHNVLFMEEHAQIWK